MLLLILTACFLGMTHAICDLRPTAEQSSANRTPGDGGYRILLFSGLSNIYIPNEIYTIILHGTETPDGEVKLFKRFILTMHSQNFSTALYPPVGQLLQGDNEPTIFSRLCSHTVAGATNYERFERQLQWQAPSAGSGCVVFTAMILENNERWYAEDGALTKTVCEAKTKFVSINENIKLEVPENIEDKSKPFSHGKLIQKRYITLPDDPVHLAKVKAVCMARRSPGPCIGYYRRWAFNPQKLKCESFWYGGCQGNQNNFLTAEVCSKACDIVRTALIREALNVTVNRDRTPDSLSPSSPSSPRGLRRKIPLVTLDDV